MRVLLAVTAALAVWGCGDKVPQSQAAKKVGEQPKQIIDKAAGDATKALQQGADRTSDAEQKK